MCAEPISWSANADAHVVAGAAECGGGGAARRHRSGGGGRSSVLLGFERYSMSGAMPMIHKLMIHSSNVVATHSGHCIDARCTAASMWSVRCATPPLSGAAVLAHANVDASWPPTATGAPSAVLRESEGIVHFVAYILPAARKVWRMSLGCAVAQAAAATPPSSPPPW